LNKEDRQKLYDAVEEMFPGHMAVTRSNAMQSQVIFTAVEIECVRGAASHHRSHLCVLDELQNALDL